MIIVLLSQNVPCDAYQTVPPEKPRRENKTDHISVPPKTLFICIYQSSPGETVQRLRRYILIHNTTFEQIRQKDVEHFYILLSRRKKNK